jgi:RNA polymerase sigma-70 factor (ECF subfamily)
VLILRDLLGWTAPEVADLLDSTVAGVNSALQRARATLHGALPAAAPPPAQAAQRHLLRRYVDAWERADVDGLVALLRDDAALRMPPQPAVVGAAAIGRFFGALPCGGMRDIVLTPTRANGRPAVVMHQRGAAGALEPHGVMVLEIAGDAIAGLDAFIDPGLPHRFRSGR